MPDNQTTFSPLPASTHGEAAVHLRRPFAPGAIGFRSMGAVPMNGEQYGGELIAAYISAQSVTERLNLVCPGRWQMSFDTVEDSLVARPTAAQEGRQPPEKRYLRCRLIISLPHEPGGDPRDALYEDIGAMELSNWEGLKTLYSDARKRAAVHAGVGAYLYTGLERIVVPAAKVMKIWPEGRGRPQVMIPAATDHELRRLYVRRIASDEVLRDLGPVLSHGEPEAGLDRSEASADAAWGGQGDNEARGGAPASRGTDRNGAPAASLPLATDAEKRELIELARQAGLGQIALTRLIVAQTGRATPSREKALEWWRSGIIDRLPGAHAQRAIAALRVGLGVRERPAA